MDPLRFLALTIARSVIHGGRIDDDARLVLSVFEQGADPSDAPQQESPCGLSDVRVVRRLFSGEVIGVAHGFVGFTSDGSPIEALTSGVVGEPEAT